MFAIGGIASHKMGRGHSHQSRRNHLVQLAADKKIIPVVIISNKPKLEHGKIRIWDCDGGRQYYLQTNDDIMVRIYLNNVRAVSSSQTFAYNYADVSLVFEMPKSRNSQQYTKANKLEEATA